MHFEAGEGMNSGYRQQMLQSHIDYCDDKGVSAYVFVLINDDCRVPNQPSEPQVICYDLASEAVNNFEIDDGFVRFQARFDDGIHDLTFPVGNVLGFAAEGEDEANRLSFYNVELRRPVQKPAADSEAPRRPSRVK